MKQYLRAFPPFVALYGILFSQLTEFGRNNVLAISGIIGITILFIFVVRYFSLGQHRSYPISLLLFVFSLCVIGLVRIFLGFVPFRDSLGIHIGLILSGVIILYLSTFSQNSRIVIFDKLVNLLAIGFVVQLLLSIYESMRGEIIGVGIDWLVSGFSVADVIAMGGLYRVDILHERFIGNAIYPSLSQLLFSGLTVPFSGMLGQHNYWGTQLPFLNLLFAIRYLETKDRTFLILLVLVLFSIVMNTSRFGLGAILLTDIILIRMSYPRYRLKINFFMALFMGLVFFYLLGKYDDDEMQYQTSTLFFRLDIWANLINLISNFSFVDYLFGINPEQLKAAVTFSLENQFFYLIFYWGVFGILFIVLLIYSMRPIYMRLPHLYKVMLLLVGVNAVFVSALANQLFEYSTITLVMLLLSYLIWRSGQSRENCIRSMVYSGSKGQLN